MQNREFQLGEIKIIDMEPEGTRITAEPTARLFPSSHNFLVLNMEIIDPCKRYENNYP